jgi:polyhydroxyalkanoate synthase subunit PhaC
VATSTGGRWPGLFVWPRPNDPISNYWVKQLPCSGGSRPRFDILFWNADTTRMTAGLHRDFLQMGVTNALVHPAE